MTGGYKIIDLYGLDLANMQLDSTKIEKIFSDIESTYKTKALLFDNYKINGIEQNATFSSAIVKNSGFEITLGDYKLLIKNNSVEDSTLHLYRHDISFYFTYGDNQRGWLICTLYTNNKAVITENNLKDFIYDSNDIGVVAVGKIGTDTIYGVYYNGTYGVSTSLEDTIHIQTITSYIDNITKIF